MCVKGLGIGKFAYIQFIIKVKVTLQQATEGPEGE
jgi:hypothetical protein